MLRRREAGQLAALAWEEGGRSYGCASSLFLHRHTPFNDVRLPNHKHVRLFSCFKLLKIILIEEVRHRCSWLWWWSHASRSFHNFSYLSSSCEEESEESEPGTDRKKARHLTSKKFSSALENLFNILFFLSLAGGLVYCQHDWRLWNGFTEAADHNSSRGFAEGAVSLAQLG